MHHHKRYMYTNFQQNRINRSVITVHTNVFANNRNLHKFATTNSNFEKKLLFSHASSYNVHVYQFLAKSGWYVDQSKTVHTNLFAKKRKLYKFATTNSNFLKNRLFQTCIIVKRTCISIFSKIGLVDQSKTCIQIYLRKKSHVA